MLSGVIVTRLKRCDGRLWDRATRLFGGGCMTLLAAGVYIGMVTIARAIDLASIAPTLVVQFLAACFLFLLLVAQATLMLTRPPARIKASGIQPRVTALLGTWLITLVVLLPLRESLPTYVSLFAAGLGALGDAAALGVVLYLGRSFSIMAESRALVVKGPYRLARHPLYLAEELALLDAVLLHWSLWAALIFACQILCQFQRVRNEERVLAATFPEYARYCDRVPMFVPRAPHRPWR